jgi:type II secretory pathway pseudopilin PulG
LKSTPPRQFRKFNKTFYFLFAMTRNRDHCSFVPLVQRIDPKPKNPESMTRTPARHDRRANRSHDSGFTLMEVLITITIIITIAALSMIGVNRMRFSAAQATSINQMRQVGTAVLTWGAEKNNGEPFYVSNGSGDYCDESAPGPNPALAPGNPAKLLFNTQNPDEGYTTDYGLFYSALVKMPSPELKDYKPAEVGVGKSWGTYVWYYPFSTSLTSKQSSASGQWLGGVRVRKNLENKLVMMTDYSRGEPAWEKLYLALLVDGTVRALTNGEEPIRPPQ